MNEPHVLRILTVDGQPIIRAGVIQTLSTLPDMRVVGEAGCCSDGLILCERLRPDLLLIEATLPGALSMLGQLRERRPETRALLLAEHVDVRLLEQALQLGVAGYLLKQINAFDLVQALRRVARGLSALAPEATAALSTRNPQARANDTLSPREQAVLKLLVAGMSNDAIAAQLHVTRSTVKFHLCNIFEKLGVRTRVEAIAWCYQEQRRPAGAPAARAGYGPGARERAMAV